MKKRNLLYILLIVLGGFGNVNADVIAIYNVQTVFDPDTVYAVPGDTIDFNLGPHHDAVEVSKETWEANDSVWNGGFKHDLGGGEMVLNEVGTYYYVCTPHAYLGMKGVIFIQEPSSINTSFEEDRLQFNVFPNPASEKLNISYTLESSSEIRIELIDITGRTVSTLVNSNDQPGVYKESFDLYNIPPGRYMIHIRTDSESRVESLILAD